MAGLPLQVPVAQHISHQEMIIEAALARDPELAFQAVYHDPTNMLPIDESWAMFNQMLQGQPRLFARLEERLA